MEEKRAPSLLIKTTYGIVDLTGTIINNTSNTFFIFCLTNVLMFPLANVQMITGVSSSIAIFTGILTNMFITAGPAMKWGRHRSLMAVFAPIASILFVLKFTRLSADDNIASYIMIVVVILGGMALGLVYNPNGAMINIIGKSVEERSMLATNRSTYTSAANIIYAYTSAPLAAALLPLVGQSLSYSLMAGIICIVHMAAVYYTVRITRPYEGLHAVSISKTVEKAKAERPKIRDMLKVLVTSPSLLALMGADLTRFMGNLMILSSMAYYFNYVAQNPALTAQYILLGGIFQTIGSFAGGRFAKKFAPRRVLFACELLIGVFILSTRLTALNTWLTIALLCCYRFFHGASYSMFFTLYSDCVVYSEWKIGKSMPAFIFGLGGISTSLAVTANSWITPGVLMAIGYSAQVAPADTPLEVKMGLLLLISIIPGICRITGSLLVLLGFRITPEKLKGYQEEIDARKAAAAN